MSESPGTRHTAGLRIQSLDASEDETVASLLHRSLANWYERNLRQGSRFGDSLTPFLHFPALYRHLDPDYCLGAWRDGRLIGVAFLHPRETHVSAGIVATDPLVAGRGVAKALMARACDLADSHGLPLRLVSSLLNLDSFSLYSRHGFHPVAVYQDVLLRVPAHGFAETHLPHVPPDICIQRARPEDAAEIARAELHWCGISRLRDYQTFLAGTVLPWEVFTARDGTGTIAGAIVFTRHPEWSMPGPAFARDSTVMKALLFQTFNQLKGREIVTLIPSSSRPLVDWMYSLGGRNIELHALQVRGNWTSSSGVALPTFLPETF